MVFVCHNQNYVLYAKIKSVGLLTTYTWELLTIGSHTVHLFSVVFSDFG